MKRCSPGWPSPAAVVAAGLGLAGVASPIATAAAGVVNAAFLVSIGLVYRVRGQRTWRGCSAATPLTGGLAFGAIALQSTRRAWRRLHRPRC